MITISLCMIVKNEGEMLERCLASVKDLMDEIIIVDTGSTDNTKEIAAAYTDKIFDFAWVDDFSKARNFSFSKATMDYIYAPDADEILDEENRKQFRILKERLLPEIEIVQMKYRTVSEFDTVLNSKTEYRPKLFKRLRTFTWIDPIHETVNLHPVVFDSDIEILHMPKTNHGKRDFSIFLKEYRTHGTLSGKLSNMYARELLKVGELKDLQDARDIFTSIFNSTDNENTRQEASCVLARTYRLENDINNFFKITMKAMISNPCSEICYELGNYFYDLKDFEEAVLWYVNAVYETGSVLDIHTGGDLSLKGIVQCYRFFVEEAENPSSEKHRSLEQIKANYLSYKEELENWQMPEEL